MGSRWILPDSTCSAKGGQLAGSEEHLLPTSTRSCTHAMAGLGMRQLDEECRAPARLAFRLHPRAVLIENALHGCQPNACAAELAVGVQALERHEQSRGFFHVEASPVVTHEYDGPSIRHGRCNSDAGLRP